LSLQESEKNYATAFQADGASSIVTSTRLTNQENALRQTLWAIWHSVFKTLSSDKNPASSDVNVKLSQFCSLADQLLAGTIDRVLAPLAAAASSEKMVNVDLFWQTSPVCTLQKTKSQKNKK